MEYQGPLLSGGAVRAIVNGEPDLRPVLQVIDVRSIGASNNLPAAHVRYRVVLSDGYNYQQAMMATVLNDLVVSGAIKKNSVLRLDECVAAAGRERASRVRCTPRLRAQGTRPQHVVSAPLMRARRDRGAVGTCATRCRAASACPRYARTRGAPVLDNSPGTGPCSGTVCGGCGVR